MTPWPVRLTFDVVAVGRRLGLVLLVVAVYCVAAGPGQTPGVGKRRVAGAVSA